MFFDLQERGTVTEPPPRATYSANVTQWEIYDAYQEDFQKQVYISLVLFFSVWKCANISIYAFFWHFYAYNSLSLLNWLIIQSVRFLQNYLRFYHRHAHRMNCYC